MEWKILKNGVVWEDRIDNEDWANATMEEYKAEDPEAEYEVLPMTPAELARY